MKLVRDYWNGGKWQWKYFDRFVGVWFDYGPSFETYEQAAKYNG